MRLDAWGEVTGSTSPPQAMVALWCVTVPEAKTKIREPVGEDLQTYVDARREPSS